MRRYYSHVIFPVRVAAYLVIEVLYWNIKVVLLVLHLVIDLSIWCIARLEYWKPQFLWALFLIGTFLFMFSLSSFQINGKLNNVGNLEQKGS